MIDKMKQKRMKWLALLTCLLTALPLSVQALQTDDLQAYLNQLPQKPVAKQGMRLSPVVDIPVDLPTIDLSQFSSAQGRTTTLTISSSVRLSNGTLSAAATFVGGGCLLEIKNGATVVLDATASVVASAASGDNCHAAVGVYGGSTFVQNGLVVAPEAGLGTALDCDDNSVYQDKTVSDTPVESLYDWTIGPGGDFPDINSAMDDDRVSDGDELEVLENTSVSEPQIINKSVTLIGPGYKPIMVGNDPVWRINFNDISIEASGVTLHGLSCGTVTLRDDDAVIERCRVATIADDEDYYADNAVVRGCFITEGINVVENCGLTLQNNIIIADDDIDLCEVNMTHNIIYMTDADSDITYDGQSSYNIFGNSDGMQLGSPSLTNDSYSLQTLFTCTGNIYDDRYWRLAESSPAKGNDVDYGPWDGDFPYWLNGLEAIEPDAPVSGDYLLDLNAADNPEKKTYKSLLSLFTAMANGIEGDMTVKVANSVYYYTVDDTTYPIVQAMANQASATEYAIEMTSTSGSTFNFQIDNTFLANHSDEAADVYGIIREALKHITLTNVAVMFNGNAVINDDFQVEPNDLLALKNMYQNWGGVNWTSKQWTFETNGRRASDFPGVTFDENGRVTSINLENNRLKGQLFRVSSPQLEMVTSLNLCRNELEGDISMLTASMTRLQTLNLSYNLLTGVSEPSAIASTCTNKNLKYQYRQWKEGQTANLPYSEAIWDAIPATIPVCKQEMVLSLPSLFDYQYAEYKYLRNANDPTQAYGTLYLNRKTGKYTFNRNSSNRIWRHPQDFLAAVDIPDGLNTSASAYLVKFHFAEGDADLSAYTNVYDVQYTLNYILAPSTITDFNYSAANTYDDLQINVQDIVATVNIILNQAMDEAASSRSMSAERTDFDGVVYAQQGNIMMQTDKEVSAIDIALSGVSTNEVSLMLNRRDFQMIGRDTEEGSRYVIFSPSGKRIPTGRVTTLLRMINAGEPIAIQCSDPYAKEVVIGFTSEVTGVDVTQSDQGQMSDKATVYDLQGRQISTAAYTAPSAINSQLRKGIYIRGNRKVVVK